MNLRRLLLKLHLIIGLVAAVNLLLLGATGAVMVFETEIDHALNASLWRVQPQGARLGVAELVSRVEKNNDGAQVTFLHFSEDDTTATTVGLRKTGGKGGSINVSPFTGELVGSLAGANGLMSKVHQFHTNLLLGANGKLITGAGALLLVVLALSGLVLWWPRKIWKLDDLTSGRKVNFDLHSAIGFWSSVFMLMFGLTGLVIHWDEEATQLVGSLTGAPVAQLAPKITPAAPGATPVTAATAFNAAMQAVPGAQVIFMMDLASLTKPVRIAMHFPEDRTPGGRTIVLVHPTTGEVLQVRNSRTAPPAYRWVKLWNRQFHTGDELGLTSRILTSLASASLPLLAITGPLIWWGRKRRRRTV